MRGRLCLAAAAAALVLPGVVRAFPAVDTCRLLAVLGENRVTLVAPMMADLASRWVETSRKGSVQSLEAMLGQMRFAGGSAWLVGVLGDDLEEHLVLLRVAGGEVAAVRLLYEWSPEGLKLTGLDFKRKVADLTARPFAVPPERIACPE